MANRIKGITVEIGGDTTKLSKALEGVNKDIKGTQTQLKDVQKLLKLDPSNTELLSQKHKLLADAVTATKEKLEVLKTAAEQANTALANGEISQQQYDALQREIIETENELKRLTTEANNSHTALEKMGVLGETLQSAGDKISGVGQKLLPVTAGVTALGTIAVKTGADFDAAMSKVAAVSGATGSEMDALREKAREMGSKTKFSASEAADAMNYMAMAGWKTNDMLSGIEGIMNLAAASGEDLASTSDIVTDALTAFGLSASDSGHFADILAAASSNANTNVSMMGETFKYVAPVAGAMGFSIEDTAVAIGLMANAGIKGSQAGTALRATLSRLAKPPKEAAEAMDALKLSITNSDGSFKTFNQIITELRSKFSTLTAEQKTSYAAMLGGQEAMSGLLSIVNASDADFNKLTNAINNSAGSAEKMANVRLDNLQGQITLLKSSLEGLGVAVYESNNVALTGAIEQVKEYVNQLTEAFNNGGFSRLIEQAGVIFAGMATKIAEQAPKLIEAAKNLIISFIDALSENDEQIINAAIEIIYTLATAILELIPQIISLGGSLLQSLIDGMNEKLPGITTLIEAIGIAFASIKIGTTIQGIVTGFQQAQL